VAICWSCFWGWPRPVAEIYQRALSALDGDASPLWFGPSHIVWSDENFESAEWCLEHFEEYTGDWGEVELGIIRRSLEQLSNIPMEVRCVEPESYNGENPELFPPADGIEMIKV